MFETTANILSSLMMWTLTCYKHGISSHFNVMTAALEPQKLTMKLKRPDYSASSTLLTHAQTILLSWLWMENRYSADCCCGQNIFFLSFLFPSLPSPNIFPFSLPPTTSQISTTITKCSRYMPNCSTFWCGQYLEMRGCLMEVLEFLWQPLSISTNRSVDSTSMWDRKAKAKQGKGSHCFAIYILHNAATWSRCKWFR